MPAPITTSKLIPINYFQQYFVDVVDGTPLSAGIVTFYQDNARTVLKPVYQQTGTPPNYTYVPITDPVILSLAGTFQDNLGNDVMLFWYPYDALGNYEPYYVTVTDSSTHAQFTREGVPKIDTGTNPSNSDLINYVPNPQFLLHNFISPTGSITTTSLSVAPGGWRFLRSTNNATDFISFPRFGSAVNNPTGNPRYACRVKCTVPHLADSEKKLALIFTDVNKFSSATDEYTFSFAAQTNNSTSIPISISLVKTYGVGGDPATSVTLQTITISPTYTQFNTSFIFGSNVGKVMGTDVNNFVEIEFQFPTSLTFDISITDVILTPGVINITNFPYFVDNQACYRSLFASNTSGAFGSVINQMIPAYDGSDLLLPVVLTKFGLAYSSNDVGKIFSCLYSTPREGELELNGQSIDPTTHSVEGVPFSRLQGKIFNYTLNTPEWGTGSNFVTTTISNSLPSQIFINVNTSGNPPNATLGATPPPFTLSDINTGDPTYAFTAWNNADQVIVRNNVVGVPLNVIDAGTSGFAVSVDTFGNALIAEQDIITISSVAGLSGLYFLISNTIEDFYVWFKVDGVGIDPAVPSRTSIEIDLLSTWNIADVCLVIAQTLSGLYAFNLQISAASLITGGQYFNFITSTGQAYYVYYIVNGVGTDPLVSSAIGIPVNILSTESAADVASDTQFAINSTLYAIPDYRAMFERNWLHDGIAANRDPDVAIRIGGNTVGSIQSWQIQSHSHTYQVWTGPNDVPGNGSGLHLETPGVSAVGGTGGNQTNPINYYAMKVIKY